MATETFRYDAFDNEKEQIRLIKIQRGGVDGTVGCELITTTIQAAPTYYALSYRWGKATSQKHIICNERQLRITSKLEAALRQLRQVGIDRDGSGADVESSLHEWLWIDQICIDQEDGRERAAQVAIMNRIFSQAFRTVVWLETSDSQIGEGLALADKIYDKTQADGTSGRESQAPSSEKQHATDIGQYGLPPLTDPAWANLWKILCNAYFSRIWILQEVYFSKSDPWVIIGDKRYSWDKLAWVAQWLRWRGLRAPDGLSGDVVNISRIADLRATKKRWELSALIGRFSQVFETTDPRDAIFSLVALSVDSQTNGQHPALRPDYVKSVAEVHRDVARYIIEKGQNLAILSYPACGRRDQHSFLSKFKKSNPDDIPSWVPDWTPSRSASHQLPRAFTNLSHGEEHPAICIERHLDALPPSTTPILPPTDPNILELHGLHLADVKYASPIFMHETTSSPNPDLNSSDNLPPQSKSQQASTFVRSLSAPTLFQEWQYLTRSHNKRTPASFHRSLALSIPTWGDSSNVSEETRIANLCAYLKQHLDAERAELQRLQKRRLRLVPFTTPFPLSIDDQTPKMKAHMDFVREHAAKGDAETFASWARSSLQGRRILFTTDNRVGIGPADMRKGDHVCALFGGQVLYVLRTRGAGYQFVGDGYVHSLIEETRESWESREERAKVFALR